MTTPRLCFAMLTYGSLDATRRCVASLAAHTEVSFDLFIVDNASTDDTPAWLRSRQEPWLHHRINAHNRGVPGGRNDLLEFVQPELDDHDWIVFVDNDLEFRAGWLEPFVQAIRQHPNARVLGKVGHLVQVEGDRRLLFPAPTRTAPVDVVSGGFACFVRADAARAIGDFDENLGLFWHEDDDYCVRALQHGFEVIAVPEAAIAHHEHASGAADAGQADGGSPDNMRYLADKWRRSGCLDRDGWIVRRSGPYLAPNVRDELQRRMSRKLPIGRTELAAAMQLLDRLVEQADPVRWLDDNRQPVPACTLTLLRLNHAQAAQLSDKRLANQLAKIETALQHANNTRHLRPLVKSISRPVASPVGHGVCRDTDFEGDAFLETADRLRVAHLVRDPYTRSAGLWQDVSIALQLLRKGLPRQGARVLRVGTASEHVEQWLLREGVQVQQLERGREATDTFDAILFVRTVDTDLIADVLARHANADTLVVITGDTALNGVPTLAAPQPHQLELDLLARTRLQPLAAIAQHVDDAVLEGCAPKSDSQQLPQLSRLDGAQILTSFVVAAKKQKLPRSHVLVPGAPRSPATMTIGCDLRTLFHADSTARGIGKFTVQHLAAVCDRDPGVRLIGFTQQERVELPPALQRAQISTRSIDRYRPDDVALMHIPDPMNMSFGFDSPLRVLRHPRTTVTFHDLTPLHLYIDRWPRANREGYLDRLAQLERSDCRVLTNSQFTADDLLAHTRVSPTRVAPILAGLHHDGGPSPSPAAIAAVHASLGIRGPFVLHVGALDPHKNFHSALNAFLMTRQKRALQLVVVGAVDPGTTQAAAFCAMRKVPDVLFTGYLPRAHLDALYASATALLFLSRAEGFGLPILEAMAKGCPVIASNATSHPEVCRDAAVMVDPDDQAGAARALEQLLQDAAFADKLRRRGRKQARAFPWRSVAERTLATWRSMTARPVAPLPMAGV